MSSQRPSIGVVIPRGEAIRNFVYSEALDHLVRDADVSILSVVADDAFRQRFCKGAVRLDPLWRDRERPTVKAFRRVLTAAHNRWLWSEVAKNVWEWRDAEAKRSGLRTRARRATWNALVRALASRPVLERMTQVERAAAWQLRPTTRYDELWRDVRPKLVFNCSHVHGEAGDLPMRVAHRLGIPTAAFIFSWDNLTSRSRILVPYDHFFVWNDGMRRQLLAIYPNITADQVVVTGTPQFDFHFDGRCMLSREELCKRIGVDPSERIVLYTTGVDQHFPEEHRTVQLVSDLLTELDPGARLVVRTYVKGTSEEMKQLMVRGLPNAIFPSVLWESKWFTPHYEDLSIYTSLLRHAHVGINAASTVSLELMMHDKPVVNLGFDPPGSNLPHHFRYMRHILFDHYRPVARSGGVMVAKSPQDMRAMLERGLDRPDADSDARKSFLRRMFGDMLDGGSGRRVAEALLEIANA